MASLSVSSGIWLKSCSSLSVASSSYALSLSIDSLPAEILGDPLVLQNSPCYIDPCVMRQRHEYRVYKLENNGALRPGGPVSLLTRKTIGLILHYVAIGALHGGFKCLTMPLFSNYLQLQHYQVRATVTVFNAIWPFKVFGGVVTDSVQMWHYRRKPYLIGGWCLCFASLLCLGLSDVPQFGETKTAWKYLLGMALSTIGYFAANVAADAIVVELAQREPFATRGHTQICAYVARNIGALVTSVFVTGAMNGLAYNGTFSWSLNPNQVVLVLAACSFVPCIGAIWLLHEDLTTQTVPLVSNEVSCPVASTRPQSRGVTLDVRQFNYRERCHLIWRLLQSRAMWQLLMFEFVASFCVTIKSNAVPVIETAWVNVTTWSKSVSLSVWTLAFIIGLLATRRYGLQKSWRYLYGVATIWVVGVDIVTVACTVFQVLRKRDFWLYMQVLAAPAVALRFIVQVLPIIELAPRGIEGTTYGLVITFRHLAIALGSVVYNAIGSYFAVHEEDVRFDSNATRMQVFVTYVIVWIIQLASLGFLKFLPRQKLEVQQLRYYGGYSTSAGWLVIGVLLSVLTLVTTTNMLSLFKSTSCLRVAGVRIKYHDLSDCFCSNYQIMLDRFRKLRGPRTFSFLPSIKHSHHDVDDEMYQSHQEDGRCDGALRDGVALTFRSAELYGLIAQYAAVGLMMGALPSVITPFLGYYLNMEGQATTSARGLLGIAWSLKVFIGIISDCFPICGYRRRPFMIIGWMLCILCLVVMASLPLDRPYFPNASLRFVKPRDYTIEEVAAMNDNAPSSGGKYVVLMMLATLGYVIADVAADGVVVEYAQREPTAIRGQTQTAIYTIRSLFSIFGNILVGFGLSSSSYGGDFDFGITFPMCMVILAICCVPVIPITWLYVSEKRVATPNRRMYLRVLGETLQSQAVYQVIAYSFFSGVCSNISYVASDPVTMYWARATSFNISVSQIIGSGVMAMTLALMGRYGLNWNWHHVIITTTIAVVALDSVCTMLTTWDIVRNQWFWLGIPIVETIPSSINFIVSSFVVVELASEGNEAAIYGLLTTVGNLSNPFSATLTKAIDKPFAVSNHDILNDALSTRRSVTIIVLLSYASKLVSLIFLVLLPKQKMETQILKRNGHRSRLIGELTIAYCLFALAWSLIVNLLGIFESTKCLPFVGRCHVKN
ncbi:hypothetical protein CCR75_003372 [Bremia lactucae]|uniref:Transmembrane protein n=1 Tax=Bremia lactucae TaxID=4779 RepID=A0A976IC59_BRELC|nr:hypothetical protein CCR75_003372 [Bremia lactucae]